MRKVALLFITDGRMECARRTIESFAAMTPGMHIHRAVVVNDAVDDPAYTRFVDELWPWDVHLPAGRTKRGFGGAIQAGWDAIPDDVEFVFHLEDDFVFNRRVPLPSMARILETQPHVAQVAMMRQPWNEAEKEAGSLVAAHPEWYEQKSMGGDGWPEWFEQSAFFTTNPSLYRRSLTELGWPMGDHSEGAFTIHARNEIPGVRFAYIGRTTDSPWVTHIGEERVGTGY